MGWFLDRVVLKNTRHPIEVEATRQQWLSLDDGRLQLFQWDVRPDTNQPPIQLVKFVGAAGRAENTTPHPFEIWTEDVGVVSVANPHGYGNSEGPARLDTLVATGLETVRAVCQPQFPIVLAGISLGAAVAICVASRLMKDTHQPVGLILRDPPQIACVIQRRFGWKTLFLPAAWASRRVPASLNVIPAASRCDIPAVFVSSRRDRVVPPVCQDKIISAYRGETRVIHLVNAGHYDPIISKQLEEYHAALAWLRAQF